MERLTIKELKELCRDKNISGYSKLVKKDIIQLIESSERSKKPQKKPKYIQLRQIGMKGKEGVVYLVTDDTEKLYAMKTFKKTKSSNTLKREIDFQIIASKANIAPRVIDYDLDNKYIVMELMNRTLVDIIKSNNNILPIPYQKQIIELYKKLDKVGIVHNDANPLNIMEREGKLFLIDFGFTKESTSKEFTKYSNPNYEIMPLGLILWLKDRCNPESWSYLKKHIKKEFHDKFQI